MKLHESSAVRVGFMVTALAVMSLEAQAGGSRSKSSAQVGHPAPINGVASFYRHSRGLPNGVAIFNQRPSPSHAHGGKSHQRALRKPLNVDESSRSNPLAMAKGGDRRPAKLESKGASHGFRKRDGRREHSRYANKGHKRHTKKQVIYGSSVYVVAPAEELYYPEEPEDDNCRSLIERGYDLSGRRVLVEWTLCFDDQGETYVPEDGRRIVARY
jgi:hypothetical protein